MKRICKWCGKEFNTVPAEAARGKASFCSRDCWNLSQRKRISRVCKYCGKEFQVVPSRLASGRGKFCSRECRDVSSRTRTYLQCKICGKEIWTTPSRSSNKQFCSYACRTKLWQGENSPNWKGGKIKKECLICGIPFSTFPSIPKKFCSRVCATIGETGENGPTWRGGISFEPYSIEFTEGFKVAIRSRDNYKCAVCWLKGKAVHHIDYNKKNTVPENCITLCNSCHVTTNFNRDYWQPSLEHLVVARSTRPASV